MKLTEIVGAFVNQANVCVKKFIDDYHRLDVSSLETDGSPILYHDEDLLYHMAADYSVSDEEKIEARRKKVGHELKSSNAISLVEQRVHSALMALVDYKGFRVVVYAAMPFEDEVSTPSKPFLLF